MTRFPFGPLCLPLCALLWACAAPPQLGEGLAKETAVAREAFVLGELCRQNQGLSEEILKEKYEEKMSLSAHSFYRGTAHIYYRDIPKLAPESPFENESTQTWIQGDMHVLNFGSFDGDAGLVFDLNDFDEAVVGSYLLDLRRLAASIVLVAREQEAPDEKTAGVVDAFAEAYLDTIQDFAEGDLDPNELIPAGGNLSSALDDFLDDVEDDASRKDMLNSWTLDLEEDRVFDMENSKLEAPTADERASVEAAVAEYSATLQADSVRESGYFRILDVARRLHAGTGSLGTPRYYVLIAGDPNDDRNSERILDVKQQGEPAPFALLSAEQRSPHEAAFGENHACRVVAAQAALTSSADPHLGCVRIDGSSYSIRERSPQKETFEPGELSGDAARGTAESAGRILAAAHARAAFAHPAGLANPEFVEAQHALADHHHAEFKEELRGFAFSYADQVIEDYGIFMAALDRGSVEVVCADPRGAGI